MNAAEVVGRTLAELGVRDAFGVLGSGNFVTTLAMHASGVAFHHARHEGGAICMADGYARVSGRVGVCSVHQGPGFTNTMTGLTEAAKARTPLLLIAGEAPAAALRSNFRLDQAGLAETVGALAERVHSGETAAADTARAFRRAEAERRPVLLSMPLDVQAEPPPASSPSAAEAHRPRRCRALTPHSPRRPIAPPLPLPPSPKSRTSSPRLAARSSSPAAAPSSPTPASRSRRSATRSAPSSPPPRWATACSRARHGRSASPAASPRRSRRGSSPRRI